MTIIGYHTDAYVVNQKSSTILNDWPEMGDFIIPGGFWLGGSIGSYGLLFAAFRSDVEAAWMVSSNMAGQSPNEMEVLMGDINGYKLGMFHRPGGLSKLFFEGKNLATYLL